MRKARERDRGRVSGGGGGVGVEFKNIRPPTYIYRGEREGKKYLRYF